MTTRAWFRVHSFTGVITGLLLFVICWSGTFAVVAHEIDWLVTPSLRVQPQATRAGWMAMKQAAETAHPKSSVVYLGAPLNRRAAATVWMEPPAGGTRLVHIDPYTARVTGSGSRFTAQRFFRDFHRRLFYPNPWGTYLVSAFALTMLASLVAALYFYKRWWTRFFRFKRGSGRVFWSELHKTAGLWSMWFVLVIGLTGTWYLFEALRGHVGDGVFAYTGSAEYSLHAIPEADTDPDLRAWPLDDLLQRVRQLRPDLSIRSIRFGENGALYVDGQAGHLLVRNRANQLHLDTRRGTVLYNQRASDLPAYWRWSDTADPLHFGDFAGLASKLVWFAFGLVLSGLVLTGTYLHAQRLARETGHRSRHRWPGTTAAMMVSLIVLAAAWPFALNSARHFGTTVDGARQLPDLAPGVEAVIIGWIAATLALIAAWIFLLWRPRAVLRPKQVCRQHEPMRSGG